MDLSAQIAKHFREVHFGGNWTFANWQEILSDVSWQQASTQYQDFNTIAALTYHVYYFVKVVVPVLEGGPLDAHDKYSWETPPIRSGEDWDRLRQDFFRDAQKLAELIENLSESRYGEDFADPKYGSTYRNLHGMIEHSHYHLGQVALIKKLVQAKD